MKRLTISLMLIFCLLATTAFAAEDPPQYPSLGKNFYALGQNNLYVIDIDTGAEYVYTTQDGVHVIEAVISFSLTDEGRKTIFGTVPGPYKDEAQWIVQKVKYEFTPDKIGYYTRLRYQVLDGNKNILKDSSVPTSPERWQQGSATEWWSQLIIHFIQYQLKNGAYTDKTGKVCY